VGSQRRKFSEKSIPVAGSFGPRCGFAGQRLQAFRDWPQATAGVSCARLLSEWPCWAGGPLDGTLGVQTAVRVTNGWWSHYKGTS
jgi:hypothetical protein